MKKPSVPKCFGGSQKIFLGCSTSSLAVFYVEQVALNRHVRRHFRLLFLCALQPKMSRRKKIQWRVCYRLRDFLLVSEVRSGTRTDRSASSWEKLLGTGEGCYSREHRATEA